MPELTRPGASRRGYGAALGLAAALTLTAGCTTRRHVHAAEFLRVNNPDVLWVTDSDQTVVPVVDAQLDGDTLRGLRLGTKDTVAIPMGRVRGVEANVPDSRKTALVATGVVTGFIATLYVLFISKAGSITGGVECGFDMDARPIQYC
jgi:hypothetical protein